MPSKVCPASEDDHETFVEIRKRRRVLVYERCPDRPSTATVFFYHGAGGTYKQFKCQIAHFVAQGYRVVSYDMFGHGRSHVTAAEQHLFTFEQYCYDALSLFDRYANDNKNILVGHSYGTSLCTLLYNERRRKVQKLVLISGGGPYALAPEKLSIFSLPTALLSCFKPVLIKVFRKVCFHSSPATVSLSDAELLSIEMAFLKFVMKGQRWDDGDEAYHALITCPVLLLLGKHDNFISLTDEISMNLILPSSVLHVLDGGHMLPIECSDEVNELISSFLTNDIETHSRLHATTICKKPVKDEGSVSRTTEV